MSAQDNIVRDARKMEGLPEREGGWRGRGREIISLYDNYKLQLILVHILLVHAQQVCIIACHVCLKIFNKFVARCHTHVQCSMTLCVRYKERESHQGGCILIEAHCSS